MREKGGELEGKDVISVTSAAYPKHTPKKGRSSQADPNRYKLR